MTDIVQCIIILSDFCDRKCDAREIQLVVCEMGSTCVVKQGMKFDGHTNARDSTHEHGRQHKCGRQGMQMQDRAHECERWGMRARETVHMNVRDGACEHERQCT